MGQGNMEGTSLLVLHILLVVLFIIRVLLRPRRDPASRIAWIVIILVFPFVGILAYILFGETNIGWRLRLWYNLVAMFGPVL